MFTFLMPSKLVQRSAMENLPSHTPAKTNPPSTPPILKPHPPNSTMRPLLTAAPSSHRH
ncbi:hypothetical protein BS50DRAFT_576058 [Corynespora cassiicola Philippines]|uniref:Uncharacterized protein n=1 Tax=Corynespora cassiicola Philippines TaxID=1448308 RepID=A0A2T2NGY3_CORCC|nr:hypothetical protein BS50DRAFT_576058 [Corynespora cassiicola Philippines]